MSDPLPPEPSARDRVLVVEDSRSVAALLAGRIEGELGLGTVVAGSRAQAREALAEHGGRLVAAVLDLHLPDAPDGEVVGDVVGQGELPALVLTAGIEDDLRDHLIHSGVCDYVIKTAPDAIETALAGVRRIHRNQGVGVLVVDDSRTARAYLVELLRRWGYRCYQASGGEEALRAVEQAQGGIRLVLCDQNMPGMDGETLIRRLRQHYPPQRLGIIGVSSHGSGTLSARLLKAGANDFLTRPFLEEELSVRVNLNVDLLELLREAEANARCDPLTGLANRRYLDELAEQIAETGRRTQQPLAAVVVDLDHFKAINDRVGHFGGDALLQAVADRLRGTVRRADVLVRAGGEEFYVVTLGLDSAGAAALGERIRSGIELLEVGHGGEDLAVTASIGVASLDGGSVEAVLEAADRAMYAAKEAGRNRVVSAAERAD